METITAREFLENMFNMDFLTSSEVETIISAMELYAKGKCREQREICASEIEEESKEDALLYDTVEAIRLFVLNAPEPQLELQNFN